MGVAEGRSTKWRRCVLPSAPFPLLDSDPPPRRMNQSARAVTTQQPISGGPVPCEAKGPISGPEKSHFYVSGRPFSGPKTPVLGQKRLFFNPHHLGLKKAHFGAQKSPFWGRKVPFWVHKSAIFEAKNPNFGVQKPAFWGRKISLSVLIILGKKGPILGL